MLKLLRCFFSNPTRDNSSKDRSDIRSNDKRLPQSEIAFSCAKAITMPVVTVPTGSETVSSPNPSQKIVGNS